MMDDETKEYKETVPAKSKKIEAAPVDGVDWTKLTFAPIKPDEFSKVMRDAGITNYEQALRNRTKIFSILQSLYGVDCATVVSFARENDK